MPEGDTIHRVAHTLQRALGDKEVLGFDTTLPSLGAAAPVGLRVTRVHARGKNLLMEFAGTEGRAPMTLHTHLRMRGDWHIYRPEDRWAKSRRAADIVVTTNPWIAVGFSMPVAQWVRHGHASRALRHLGPDLLDDAVKSPHFVERIRSGTAGVSEGASLIAQEVTLGVALMDQRRLAGIGNVYKSELCFLAGVDPFAPVGAMTDEVLLGIVENARRLMRRNLHTPRRMTRMNRRQPLWVYRRRGEPCFRCGTAVRMRRQGYAARSTYYCPLCQAVSEPPP